MADLIDREALKKHLADLVQFNRLPRETKELCVEDIEDLIDHQPTIDAVPVVHAKWVVNTDDFTPKKRCTNCGYNKPMKAGDGIEQEPEAFCPSCGATMDENGGNSQ